MRKLRSRLIAFGGFRPERMQRAPQAPRVSSTSDTRDAESRRHRPGQQRIGLPIGGCERQTIAELGLELLIAERRASVTAWDVAALADDAAIGERELERGVGVLECRRPEGWAGRLAQAHPTQEVLGRRPPDLLVGERGQADATIEQAGGHHVLGAELAVQTGRRPMMDDGLRPPGWRVRHIDSTSLARTPPA